MFLPESDLTPFEEHYDKMLTALTDWAPSQTESSTEVKMLEMEGDTYAEAYASVNNMFIRNLWRDSQQIIPPTEELVDWILTGTEMDPDEVIGPIWPRGGIATVRMAAVSLAMAGGRPEYLPFLLAAAKLMVNDGVQMQSWNATTNSTVPVFVVNGPATHQIRLGSGYGLLGPDPLHPAGQILGRAVRLMQQDLGGALPGTGTMAIFGGMRATNAFFAEDDEGVPEGWTTWAEERGFSRDQNVITITIINSMKNHMWDYGAVETNQQALNAMSAIMAAPNSNRFSHPDRLTLENRSLDTGMVLIPRAVAKAFSEVSGWSKSDVKNILWEQSKVPYEVMKDWGYMHKVMKNDLWKDVKAGDLIPICPHPEQVTLVVAGGDQGGHGYWMDPVIQGDVVSIEVELPSNWDDLLLDAEIDMGALPTSR